MRILIVNGYSQDKGRFEQYQEAIKKVKIDKIYEVFVSQRELLDTETEFFIRDASNLQEFLFDGDAGFGQRESARMFDFIDFVFIEVESTLRPWQKSAHKFTTLVRMCIRTNKIILASSASMQILIYLIASNFETESISILNGVNGSPLGDLSKVTKPLDQIRHDEYFLDNVTGDLYGIHNDWHTKDIQWQPVANAGIHSRRAAEEFKKIGQFVIKAPVYRSKQSVDKLYVSRTNEEICSIKKCYMHHWLFRKIENEGLVHSVHSWDVHAFNIVNPQKTFTTLAESPKGPSIVQMGENIVGTQFCIDKKYEMSTKILENFVLHMLMRIRNGLYAPQEILTANNQMRQKKLDLDKMMSQMGDTASQSNGKEGGAQFAKLKFSILTKFHHVGYAAKKSNGLEIVVNNAINDGPPFLGVTTMNKTSPPKKNKSQKMMRRIEAIDLQETTVEEHLQQGFNKNSSEIRQMLHPSLKRDGIPESQPMWIPGRMTSPQGLLSTVPNTTVLIRTQSATTAASRQRFLKNLADANECREHPIIRTASPYITQMEVERKNQKESDKQIIGPKSFKTRVPLQPPRVHYDGPDKPVSSHNFREVQKNKWIADNFKSC